MRRMYGPEHFRQIGAKGASVVKQRRGLAFYREIGRLGGQATHREHGREHYVQIGSLGGQRPRRSRTPDTDQSRRAGQSED